MSDGATRGPEVIESGPAPRLAGQRVWKVVQNVCRRVFTRRALVIGLLVTVGVALTVAGETYRHRIAAEDRVSLATAAATGVSVDLATRTLLLDLVIDNRSRYAVTLVKLDVVTPGLSVLPGTADSGSGATALPVRVAGEDEVETTLLLRPDCKTPLPSTPAFTVVATSSRGHRHVVALPPFGPLAQLWSQSVRSACFDRPE